MKEPKHYLLNCIVNEGKQYPTLGLLDAKHIDDISLVMLNFVEECAIELVSRLNKGETVSIGNSTFNPANSKK